MIAHYPLLLVLAVAVVAPLLSEIPVGVRVPVVVLEVALGIVIGPHVLEWVQPSLFLGTMVYAGTAVVLFMAGMEMDFARIRGRPLLLAIAGWPASVALAFLVVALLRVVPGVHAPLMVTIALSTTGLAGLLPILRDNAQLDTPFGRYLLAAGTIGEVGPIVASSLVLANRYTSMQEFGYLLALLALVGLAAAVGIGARPPRLLAMLSRMLQSSTQLQVRLALLLMGAFVVLSVRLGFEGILGAFAAGMVVGLATRDEGGRVFREKMDAVGFGWFTPFFFVGTGIEFDLGALTRDATTIVLLPAFVLLFLLVRGLPTLLYRRDLGAGEQRSFACLASVPSLGLVVVITQLGLLARSMNADIAQAMVGAALLSLLVYPLLAQLVSSGSAAIADRANVE